MSGAEIKSIYDEDTRLVEVRYTAFGEIRYESGDTTTDYTYTGQREANELGLSYYVARWYDPEIGHFTQPDSIVPGAGDALAWDRYAYVKYNPIKYVDPSGKVFIEYRYARNGAYAETIPGRHSNNWNKPMGSLLQALGPVRRRGQFGRG